MIDCRLIAVDLDGTLIGSAREFHLYDEFRARINELRRDNHCVWAVCTSRTLGSFHSFFAPMKTMGILPDFIIARHAYIYGRGRIGYFPHLWWNVHVACLQWINRMRIRRAIDEWHRIVLGSIPGVRTVVRRKDRLWLSFDTEDFATNAAHLMEDLSSACRYLKVFRYRKEIEVRSVPFTKGLAVSELAKHLQITRGQILAIGNGHNDASMLDGTTATHTGCPMNSEPEIVQLVHETGGHIAGKPSLAGVLEILEAYRTGGVCSDLPSWWKDPAQTDPSGDRSVSRRQRSEHHGVRAFWWSVAVTYVVLLVLANFNVLPYSHIVRKPMDLLLRLIMRVVDLV